MHKEREINASVSGSFEKHKPEIDKTIDELTDLGVKVLAPDKGWLLIPVRKLHIVIARNLPSNFRPLPSEIGMTIKEIEDRFLSAISRSDFLYIENPEGYIGHTVALELGFAIGGGIPVFSRKAITVEPGEEPLDFNYISYAKPKTPADSVRYIRNNLTNQQKAPQKSIAQ